MQAVRGDLNDYGMAYANSSGGSGKMARSIDPTQTAIAVATIKVATASMNAQFDRFLTVFSEVA
jgi:hypothetical protein